MFDPQCASMVVGGDQFIFDVQTHWFNAPDLANYPAYTQAFGGLFAIATEDNYINTFFCNSDVSMVALTSWPGSAAPRRASSDAGTRSRTITWRRHATRSTRSRATRNAP